MCPHLKLLKNIFQRRIFSMAYNPNDVAGLNHVAKLA